MTRPESVCEENNTQRVPLGWMDGNKGGEVVVHDEDDVAAPAAVAAVRAASGHELLTMEAHCAVAALAGMEPDGGDVDKIGLCCHTGPPVLRKNSSQRLFSALLFE